MFRKIISALMVLAAFTCAVSFLFESCSTEPSNNLEEAADLKYEYVGSGKCKSCHSTQFADWQNSNHFKAMQPANDTTVLGDFNNASFKADGVESKFFKKDGKFFINTQGDDGVNHDYKIEYTFGIRPLQQYIIAFPGGKFQVTRQCWDTEKQKWFHQYPGEIIDHSDWLHWTGNGQNWNTMCSHCHSTNVQKNYSEANDSYHTTYNEVMVSCESCHGPASAHIQLMQSEDYAKSKKQAGNKSGFQHKMDSASQITRCAECHTRKTDINPKLASSEFGDNMIIQNISNEFYHADGQIDDEDFELGSFLQSKMYKHGVVCSNCHQPHSGKLKATGNNLCLQCHKPKYDTEEHHMHKLQTEGAQCISCHMPSKYFMVNHLRHDHSFRIPRPDQSVSYGTPNTCNSCHKDKTAQWAADKIKSHYGNTRAYHFSDDLIPGSLLNVKSETHLIKLLNDTSQPEIARATATYYLSNIGTQASASALIKSLNDLKPFVRYQALRSLAEFPADVWRNDAARLLNDPVRMVRIAAADLYMSLPANEINAEITSVYNSASGENFQFLSNQLDFAVGNLAMGDYYFRKQDHPNAIKYYKRALVKDSLMNAARLNLSSSLNASGKNDEALKVLKDAAAIDPQNDRIFYNLALLYNELNDMKRSKENFEKCIQLKTQNVRVYYNYGLLLQQEGNSTMSEIVFLRGLNIDSYSTDLNYAISILYMQQNQKEKAAIYIKRLQQIAPNEPQYQQLFNAIK